MTLRDEGQKWSSCRRGKLIVRPARALLACRRLTAFDWDQAGEAELEQLIDVVLEGVDEDRADELTKRYLRGAYIRYCAAHVISPFQPTN